MDNSSARKFLFIALLLASTLCAQDYRAHLQGIVTDQTQAAVVGAKVTLTETETGVETVRPTDTTGHYIFDYVKPGIYTVKVEKSGFNSFKPEGIQVVTRGDVTVNAQLTVGNVTQSVDVSSTSVALEFNTTTMSQTVSSSMLANLPVLARNPFTLVLLDPAVVNRYSTLDKLNPYYMQAANGADVGGSTGGRNELLLDGVPVGVGSRGSYSPTMDAVQEVSIQQNSVDAEFGFSAGGNLSVSMKSGTNEIHGSAYYFGRNPSLNALENRYTRTKSIVRQNSGGGTVGAPVIKNKLFTFFSYEQWDKTEPREGSRTLPTDLERTGDYSQSKNINGGLRTIYDPWTTQITGSSTATRLPFAGNVIPASRIDPSAAVVMNDIWKPNNAGDNITGANNYKMTYAYWMKYHNFSNRTDWNANDKFRMYTRYSYFHTRLDNDNYGNSPATPSSNGGLMDTINAAADAVYTVSPTLVVNARFGVTYLEDDFDSEWSKVGEEGLRKIWGSNAWYSSYLKGIPAIYYPSISITGGGGFGKGSTWFYRPRKYNVSTTVAKDRGRHYMKTGMAFRHSYGLALAPNLMNFTFSPNTTANTYISPDTKTSGDGYAAFLLGAISSGKANSSSGNANYKVPQNIIQDQWAVFFQDDFKLNRRVTLNLGLRYEFETAAKEENNYMSRYLDLTSPISEMYSNPPVMPSEVTSIRTTAPTYNGAWVFTDSTNRGLYSAPKTMFLPRAGVAVRVNDKTAVRLGYARYALPMTNAIGLGYNIPADGYNATTNIIEELQGIPQTVFSNPFPADSNPLIPSAGKSWGRYTNLGSSATWWKQNMKASTNDRLNATFQREMPFGIRTDITYFFAFTHHYQAANIWGGTGSTDSQLNMVDPQLSYTYKSALDKAVANPFYLYMTANTFPGSLRNLKTVSVSSLLRPYPQYYGDLTEAYSDRYRNRYQALQIKAERAAAQGVSFTFGYNYNREASTEYFNNDDKYLNRLTWIGSNNPRHRVSAGGTFEIPVGKNRKYFSHMHPVLENVFGGWATSHMVLWNSGTPLRWGQFDVSGDPKLDNPTGDNWFNTSVFSRATPYTPRTNPWQYAGLVGPGFWEWDGTIVKNFQVTERFKLELRLDAYNVPNTFMLSNPNQSVTSSTFGKCIGPASNNLGRQIQYTARIHF